MSRHLSLFIVCDKQTTYISSVQQYHAAVSICSLVILHRNDVTDIASQ